MPEQLIMNLQTLTPLWTGGVDQTPDRLHETGIIGSLRWWYEALVRGLGGYACDPRSEDRCPDKGGKHCAVCELFGCTGWARKFRLRVVDENRKPVIEALQANQTITLQFLDLRPMFEEERWLLSKAVWIAATYGALGGKTTYKPQKGPMGEDYGVVKWIRASETPKPEAIPAFLQQYRQGHHQPSYPALNHFFFFRSAFLSRLQMNPLLGLDPKGRPLPTTDVIQRFLQGKRGSAQQDAISKKLFSFRTHGGRIWGYGKDAQMRDEIVARIELQLGNAKHTVKTGEEVLHEL